MLFHENITNLEDWSNVFQNKTAFTPLAREIFAQCGLLFPGLENCTPGSNAVFRAGPYLLKIFAPEESKIGGEGEFLAETYGLERAQKLGVSAPRILAWGVIHDRYVFRWLLLEWVEGALLAHAAPGLSDGDWKALGAQLRQAVERLDTPCPPFHDRALQGRLAEERWKLFPETFRRERAAFLENWKPETVFVHGDLNADNLLVTADDRLVLIDFADCRTAPFETELAALMCDGFRFPAAWLGGFLGESDRAQTAQALVRGLLLHDYGAWIIRDRVAAPETLYTLKDLERSLLCCLNR